MCTKKCWAGVVLLLLAMLPETVFCQEIKGDTVYASATQQTVLYFPSKVTSVAYEEKSGFSRFDTIIDHSLVSLRAKKVNAAPTVLNITEGNRSHSIVLAYKPELTNAELHYDWNDVNELRRDALTSDKKIASSSTKAKKQNLTAKNSTNPSADVVDNNSGEDDYNDLLIKSYNLVQKKNFAESKKLYDKAMALKDKKFNDDLTRANNFFIARNYEEAKITYLLALSIKPDDAFARRRLKESQRLSQTTATASVNTAAKVPENKSAAAINHQPEKIPIVKKQAENIKSDTGSKQPFVSPKTAANNEFAKTGANKIADTMVAIAGKPKKISIAKKPSENIKSQKAVVTESLKNESQTTSTEPEQQEDFDEDYAGDDKYDSVVAQATKLFNNKSYAEALVLYKKAHELKPNEDLAPKMIRFVNEVMSHSAEEQKRDKDFRNKARIIEIKDLGTEAILNKDWLKAKQLYTEMLTLNPIKNDEEFARKKIEAIDLQLEKLANMKPVEKEPEVVLAPPKNRREARERRLLAERNAILASGSKKAATRLAETTAAATSSNSITAKNNGSATSVPAATIKVLPADKPTGKNSMQNVQSLAISYTHEALAKKYPAFNFNEMPDGQLYDTTDIKNRLVHYEFCKKVLAAPVQLSLADSNTNVKVICQNIIFNGKNAYLKILIENKSLRSDFLTGAMQLSLLKSTGLLQKSNPDFISDFPVVMPRKEFAVVYVTDNFANVNPNDVLYLEISDRTKKNKLTIAIPGNIYLKQKPL